MLRHWFFHKISVPSREMLLKSFDFDMKLIFVFLLTGTIMLFCGSCKKNDKLFQLVAAEDSGIDFNNRIIENDSINPINLINVYNGGGVGVGDFNNDGLQDIYFTGNMVPINCT
jgi:hypothetical protein